MLNNDAKGRLLLVIPPVALMAGGGVELDGDFANNLSAYLRNFDHVTVACPVLQSSVHSGLRNTVPLARVEGHERATFIGLPYTYREDRHLRHYFATKRLLRDEIAKADYLLFSPHAMYDWSTLAAKLAISMNRSYDMEGDWNLENILRLRLSEMPSGLKKIRKSIWLKQYRKVYYDCLRHSSVALLQGQDVYDAYKDIAPNPQKVLNIQITPENYIPAAQLEAKLSRIRQGAPLKIAYAGRAIDMKGPLAWVQAIHRLLEKGVKLHATWFGDGELMGEMKSMIARLQIGDAITLAGLVDRAVLMAAQRESDIFMFCHRTAESPRNLVEALACGCPIVGFGSLYSRDLVALKGGGAFVDVDDWQGLADLVWTLDRDREALARLVENANESAHLYDRDKAIQQRIDLIRKFVKPPKR